MINLAAKVNSIDTSVFVLKTKHDIDKTKLENKMPDNSSLVKKQIILIKLLKQKVKFPMLVIQQKKLH